MTNAIENWLPVVGFEGLYEVSDWGRVRSLDRHVDTRRATGVFKKFYLGRPIAQTPHRNDPYLRVMLCKDGVRHCRTVHSLVAEAYLGLCSPGLEVCHRNGLGNDNALRNLRYDTRSSNREDSRRLGTLPVGERIAQSKLTAEKVRLIRSALGDDEAIASTFGVSRTQIGRVRRREAWLHVD